MRLGLNAVEGKQQDYVSLSHIKAHLWFFFKEIGSRICIAETLLLLINFISINWSTREFLPVM
jgi:hypothetical protein